MYFTLDCLLFIFFPFFYRTEASISHLSFFASSKIALVTTRRVFHVLGNNGKFFIITMGCFIYILGSSNSIVLSVLVQSHFELVSSVLALEATELVSEPVTQMTVELINNHLISVQ